MKRSAVNVSSLVKIGITQRKIGKRFPFSAPPNQALQRPLVPRSGFQAAPM
jgi:hypothetical protein